MLKDLGKIQKIVIIILCIIYLVFAILPIVDTDFVWWTFFAIGFIPLIISIITSLKENKVSEYFKNNLKFGFIFLIIFFFIELIPLKSCIGSHCIPFLGTFLSFLIILISSAISSFIGLIITKIKS